MTSAVQRVLSTVLPIDDDAGAKAARRLLASPDDINTVIEAMEERGNVYTACKNIGIPASAIPIAMQFNTEFAQAIENARLGFFEKLESAAFERAVNGVEKDIYYRGEYVATERQYSDTLLIKLLEANIPEKFTTRLATKNDNTTRIIIEDGIGTNAGVVTTGNTLQAEAEDAQYSDEDIVQTSRKPDNNDDIMDLI